MLDELERLARAVIGGHAGLPQALSALREYESVANPATVLKLIAVARAANDAEPIIELLAHKTARQLRAALEALKEPT